jgi:peptidoglycan biosynthesis protein MviN/MurJ (putative lipid II flippase)
VAGLTMLSRLFGLIRTLVFSQTVGASCLGTAYATANQVPNLVYELVLGGAVSAAAGVTVCLAAPARGKLLAAGTAVIAASCAVIAFGVVAYVLDRGDSKTVLGWLRRIARRRVY